VRWVSSKDQYGALLKSVVIAPLFTVIIYMD
jgi:hypothetical protein